MNNGEDSIGVDFGRSSNPGFEVRQSLARSWAKR
jgi:hypothetical protein